jgi:hypothetical protein
VWLKEVLLATGSVRPGLGEISPFGQIFITLGAFF